MSSLQMMITGYKPGDINMEIEQSKDINYTDSQGMTALHWAIICGKTHIVRWLLSRGANPFGEILDTVTPLELAAKCDYQSIPLLVAAGCSPDLGILEVGGPVHYAVRHAHQDHGLYIVPLLEAGWSINQQKKGRTPLLQACLLSNKLPTFEFLIQRGADVNLPDFENYTPLLISAEHQAREYVDRLIQADADCTITTIYGRNILHCVAERGNIETIRVLIKWRERLKDVDLNRRCNSGLTPLDYAEKRHDVPEEWAGVFKELILAILEVQNAQDSVRVTSQEVEENPSDREVTIVEVQKARDTVRVMTQEVEDDESDREFFEDALEVHEVSGDA